MSRAALLLLLASCFPSYPYREGAKDDAPTNAVTYQLSGTVTGLVGSHLILRAGEERLDVSTGSFRFASALSEGAPYLVSIDAQPTAPAQTCRITSGAQGVASADATVRVQCAFTLHGEIHGLSSGTLRIDASTSTPLGASGSVDILRDVGAAHDISLTGVPSDLACTIFGAVGTVTVGDASFSIYCLGPVQPTIASAPNWLDMARSSDAAAPICNEAPVTSWRPCVYGGLYRTSHAPGVTCASASARDTRDAFVWNCRDGNDGATFVSVALAKDKHLTDVIDFGAAAFAPMGLEVTLAAGTIKTPVTLWWHDETVRADAADCGTAGPVAPIYVVTQTCAWKGPVTMSGRYGIAVAPGQRLMLANPTSPDRGWVSGPFGGTSGLYVGQLSVVDGVDIEQATDGVHVESANGVWVRGLRVRNLRIYPALTLSSSFSRVDDLRVANSDFAVTVGGDDNVVSNVRAFGIGQNTITVDGMRNLVVGVTSTDDDAPGAGGVVSIGLTSASNETRNLTSVNRGASGNANGDGYRDAGDGDVLVNSLIVNASDSAIELALQSNSAVLGDVVFAGSPHGVNVVGMFPTLTGPMLSPLATPCEGGTSCVNPAFQSLTFDPDAVFVGKKPGDLAYSSSANWLTEPDDFWTGWGPSRSGVSSHGACTSGTCSRFDFALRAALAGAPRNVRAAATRLEQVIEIDDDGVGDDDARCESNERCLLCPNIGAYQGEGALQALGTVDIETATGVQLFRYSQNGR